MALWSSAGAVDDTPAAGFAVCSAGEKLRARRDTENPPIRVRRVGNKLSAKRAALVKMRPCEMHGAVQHERLLTR